jgi:hypothetical protein
VRVSLVTHGRAERRLPDMSVGQLQRTWGRCVLRLDARSWSVDGGPTLPLLPAIDAVLGKPDDADGCRFPAAYRARAARG